MNREDHQYIGSSVTRREDYRLLTGEGVFVADIRLAGMLDVALVRSQFAHGRIVAVDMARARTLQGVELVLDGAGLAEHLAPLAGMQVSAPPGWTERVEHEVRLPAQPVIAVGKTHYVGEPLAVVVATDAYRAADAAEMVAVDIEPLAVVADAQLGRAETATRMHDDLDSNVLARMCVAKGAVADVLARAPHR